MRRVVALLGMVWAALNFVLALIFVASSFTAKTLQHEGILAEIALLVGGALIALFGVMLANASWKLFQQRTAA